MATGHDLSEPQTRVAGWTALGGAVLAGALLRLIGLGTFPRVEADEGLWTTSSKNFLLYGDWFLDGRTHIILSPLFHALTLPFFSLLGPHIISARLLSAVAGIATIVIVFLIARRLRLGEVVGITAAILCAVNEWAVLVSRKALVESVEVCFLALSVLLALAGGVGGAVAAGIVFGLTLLVKSNALAMLPIVALAVMLSPALQGRTIAWRPALVSGSVFVATVALVAGLVYFWLFRLWPDQFRAAFLFVLNGRDQVPDAAPVASVGRFGFEPKAIASAIAALVRESPFVYVLASLGAIPALVSRNRGWLLVLAWAATWHVFSFLQLFQPERYFYLAFPAIVLLAAGALDTLVRGVGDVRPRRLLAALTTVIVLFEVGYVAANASKNREDRVAAIQDWSRANLTGQETVLAASYLALDIPARALGFYFVAPVPDSLATAIKKYHVDFVLWDRIEWPAGYRAVLDRDYPRVAEWPFGAMYRTSAGARTAP